MKIKVDIDKVEIEEAEQIESGEYNVTPCIFELSEEYSDLINTAVFTANGKPYKVNIFENKCTIPAEVLEQGQSMVEIGVYGYASNNDELTLRYSPKPACVYIEQGSYREAENSTPPTPTQFEQYEQQLHERLQEVENVDIDVSKELSIATVTITNRNGTKKTVEIHDGANGQDGAKGDPGEKGEPGAPGENGSDGKDGTNGQDGYTPVRGTDYWTAQDIAAIEQYCDDYIDEHIAQAIGGAY